MLIIQEVLDNSKVKNALTEYERAVFESREIEGKILRLIEEKMILLTPVVRMKPIVIHRLESVNNEIEVYIYQHMVAIDRVIERREYFDEIQNRIFERRVRENNL